VPADSLRSMTRRAVDSLATPQPINAACDAALATELRRLARLLLPTLQPVQLTADGARPRLLISPDAFLDALAFEALNLSDVGYSPVLRDRDVAYLRYFRSGRVSKPRAMPALAVVEPKVPRSIQRRHQGIRPLERGADEVHELAELLPGSTVLSGVDASKQRLMRSWQGAHVLYFATHVFRDSEAPYLNYIALAAPESIAAESYLGVSDIRAADLTACELVVLSACASGAPYVAQTFSGVSLAGAFLDAGAHAAVRTLWNVRDEDAQRIMSRFMHHWIRLDQPPVKALGDARRELLGSVETATHPFTWAAYGIELTRLPVRR
jgi:CHAT domain-containing protein